MDYKIGILREEKNPPDKRVVLTPEQCKKVKENYPEIEIFVQPSEARAFTDEEFLAQGITLKEDLSDCDILLGIKEIPVDKLLESKAYMFFSHTIKLQAHNKKLFRAIVDKKVTLIDYEVITDKDQKRLVAFGRYAGIVGTYNAFIAVGKKLNLFSLKPANQCFDRTEMENELSKLKLPKKFKIVMTGDGKVASGALEIISKIGIKKVTPEEFLTKDFEEPVYIQLKSKELFKPKDGRSWDTLHFYNNPELYECDFAKYTKVADLYIACHFWNPKSGVFFTNNDIKREDFRIKVIADISCDINGPIPSTIRASSIATPLYGYDKNNHVEIDYMNSNAICVMAIDNLPCELPRSASDDFGNQFIKYVIPNLVGEDKDEIIKRATITLNGVITDPYRYMNAMLLNSP